MIWLEWYNDTIVPAAWNATQVLFCRYFSIHDRSLRDLHERWRDVTVYPNADDIEVFISNIKQTACQFTHNDIAVLNLIKACMPANIYFTLYPVHELDVAVSMLKGIYAKKLDPKTIMGTIPFSM